MIFVTVGTNEARFERLLRAIADISTDESFVIQHGHSAPVQRPNTELVDFLPFETMVKTMRNARVVVTHAGVGSVMVALSNGRRPVVVPRRKSLGEAVDDHQLQLGRRFARAGLVTLVETEVALADALAQQLQLGRRLTPAGLVTLVETDVVLADALGQEQTEATPQAEANALADDLRIFLESVIASSPARP